MLSPEPKRTKTFETAIQSSPVPVFAPTVVAYPTSVPVPSETTIGALYASSLKESGAADTSTSTDEVYQRDQQYLKPAGVLSFEQVMLPALGLEEERALKLVQSKIQRDAPEYKFIMENCRRLVRQSMSEAISAVNQNRQGRVMQQAERRRVRALEVVQAREIRKQGRLAAQELELQDLQRQQENSRAKKKQTLIRSLPKNQELWKEVVFLTSSIARLEKEQRLWVQADKDLKQLEGIGMEGDGVKSDIGKENTSSRPVVLQSKKNSLQKEAERKVGDILMASDRIQKGLGMVLTLLKDSEEVRKELYEKYRKDHMFQGYQSINDPKGVIRFLSQNSEDGYFDEY
ncbi:MAG: hypothetical protein SGILL_008097 [Bacillariaceae sp.]